jgi:hypothetical protein
MNAVSVINDAIEKKLLDLNVAYIAKILSTNGTTAKIQPLGMIKQVGETAKTKAPVSNVPIIESARYRLIEKKVQHVTDVSIETESSDGYLTSASLNIQKETVTVLVKEPLKVGDTVMCLCADRDITDAKNGKNSVPVIGHHSMSDSVVIGIL